MIFINIVRSFELLANYTKTNTKLIPYFDQSLNHEKLIENIRIRGPKLQ